ncbi:unnamed protein product [Parnassius apollo]|uniref:(apollo) hypothetical protein n=1 Tax=Parnassius apollo TaxID=110799 RepID=A0A8S3X1G1_PARAO|nr:unnamed protein product [Parnassius apollo]
MSIPPFPSQDLAKLVLGYLAEEQLMTAYDEFLQASPYLDALGNEYDRIFMTSLKNIVAEYRAVKIYVETCKPITLRKKLFQCSTLLDIVKFLIQNVDLNKISVQEHSFDRTGSTKNVNAVLPSFVSQSTAQSNSQIETTTLGGSVETTSLSDLPGNVTSKRKSMKVLDRESRNSQTIHSDNEFDSEVGQKHCPETLSATKKTNLSAVDNKGPVCVSEHPVNNHTDDLASNKKCESIQKIEEFNNILDFVCNNGSTAHSRNYSIPDNVSNQQHRISTAGTFQNFSSGIYNGDKVNIPVSNPAETNKALIGHWAPLSKVNGNTYVTIGSINTSDLKSKSHLILRVEPTQNSQGFPAQMNLTPTFTHNSIVKQGNTQKREEQKIKILSDVKVDNAYDSICGRPKMPPVLSNATSTPKVETLLINGTPAYTSKAQCVTNYKYTKDEIMAMPTIILMPSTSGNSQNTTELQPIKTMAVSSSIITATTSSAQNILRPLTIDVLSNITAPNLSCDNHSTNEQNNGQKHVSEQSLVKTVELTGHVSVPKDTHSTTGKTSTPQGLPPKRKSSSTPRRTSHVRVLDFTTPRRILHETINEQSSNNICTVETEHTGTPNVLCKESSKDDKPVVIENVSDIDTVSSSNIISCSAKENKVVYSKKSNWDADLRALAVNVGEIDNCKRPLSKAKHKTKAKNTKKKNSDENNLNKTITENEKVGKKSKKGSSKLKGNKNKPKPKDTEEAEEIVCKSDEKVPIAIKPTINIITGNEWSVNNHENEKKQSKTNTSNERIDTPENDRIGLQNVIGAKLNISELLETPYKQALYDIQMETPKFLGPDLPDEPISEVKIMNIPTPRFLCSPKGTQATPSSYSSRPTDYSSGGSYYKPDDQDYVLSTEVLECPVSTEEKSKTSQNGDQKSKKQILHSDIKNNESRSTRPVRKCTKNVSYFKNQNASKVKDSDENSENSDATTINNSFDNKSDNQLFSKNSKESVTRSKRKSETNKKISLSKKNKSPMKREASKTFMKIKPRRSTPIKETLGGKSRKIFDSSLNKQQKRINNKDKNTNLSPVAASAPTKSRRKSSTPRKIHCTKTFNSESSGNNSPEEITKSKQEATQDNQACSQDSDVEQLPLRWSDDGSQDGKSKEIFFKLESLNDSDDISKIKEYIETSVTNKPVRTKDCDGSLHIDLIKRGFDAETAKIIERDLLDSPRQNQETNPHSLFSENSEVKNRISVEENSARTLSNTSVNLEIIEDDDDNEEIELSIHECNEDTTNYIKYQYDDSNCMSMQEQPAKLKDKFSMEVCIEDGVTIRLRATPFSVLLDQDPQDIVMNDYVKETEIAVSSISNIDKLYTPMKDPKAQVYEIFDSTLTSLDTPLKLDSPKIQECESVVTEIALEVEQVEYKEKIEVKKRKRLQSGTSLDESTNNTKKAKSETSYLLNTANIQNIDIESVLSKLHGP